MMKSSLGEGVVQVAHSDHVTVGDLGLLDEAGAAFVAVLQGVEPGRLDEASSCDGWSVRELIAHVVAGNLMYAAIVGGSGAPADGDVLGGDPVRAFRDSLNELKQAFSADGVMDKMFQTPRGERPAPRLVTRRAIEMSVHGWDLADSIGRRIELTEPLVEASLEMLRMMLSGGRAGLPFNSEQSAPEGASPADRLAAYAGRKVA
jgi:uncharacterized protein (TIGR03086 family)